MKSFENIELFQEAPPPPGGNGGPIPSTNDQIAGDNSTTAVRDREAGARADQANTARGSATALPGTAGTNTIQGYNRNAEAMRDWIMSLSNSDRDLLQQRIQQEFLLVGDAIKKNADVLRSIEQMKAGFSGMCQVISVFARALGATEIADGAMNMARELTPQPVMPALSELENFGHTVIGSLPAEAQANARAALDGAIGILREGEAAAPEVGSRVVEGAGEINPEPAISSANSGGGAGQPASVGRVTRQEWDALVGSSGITTGLPALNALFAGADADGNGELSGPQVSVLNEALQRQMGITADQKTNLRSGLNLELTN